MPKKRTCKPPVWLFRQAHATTKPAPPLPPKPSRCGSVRDLKDRELWKTNAESYCNGDKRGNRPLFISQYKDRTLDILDSTGRKIAFMRYYGRFEGGYQRHYLGTGSGENPYKLLKKAKGNEHLFIKRGSECIRVNAIRRLGYFRSK